MSQGRRVDTHLVGTSSQQTVDVAQFVDAAADGERDVDFARHTAHHIGERFATLVAGGDVEKHQLIGSCLAIGFTELDGVAGSS